MGTTKKRNKKKLPKPPLTLLDKIIYIAGFVLTFFLSFSSIFLVFVIREKIAFDNPDVIANVSSYDSAMWFVFSFDIVFGIGAIIILIWGLEEKKPIFGDPKIQYGYIPYREDFFPIFYNEKHLSEKAKKEKKNYIRGFMIYGAVLTVLLLLTPLSFFSRATMNETYTIEEYDLVGELSATHNKGDFSHLTIETYLNRRRYGSHSWHYKITIKVIGGKEFSFSDGSFRDGDMHALDYMLKIKDLFDEDDITVEGADKLDRVIDYYNYDEAEVAKLERLFSE